MTILQCVQDAALELGLVKPSTVVTNTTDLVAQQLLAFANRAGIRLRSDYDWPQLTKEYAFTLSNGTAAYAMPGDFERFSFMTHWNRDTDWAIAGPMTEIDWQYLKSAGTVTSYPFQRWRFKDCTTSQFVLDPTPGSDEEGDTLVFEYYRKNWIRPKLWVAGASSAAGSYAFYNGNWYYTAAGGTNGATPPTHTSGSDDDDTVTWTYISDPYERATADTDVPLLPGQLITMGIKWMYRQSKSLEGWEVMRSDFEAEARKLSSANRGAENLNLNVGRYLQDVWQPRSPDSGFGS